MARKKDTPQKAALREMMSVILEGALDQEMDEELGYSKYDYHNKETDNSRNEHSQKTMHTCCGDMKIDIPWDRKGEFEPQIVKKYQNTVTQDMEEKNISMYAKGMTTNDIESHMRNEGWIVKRAVYIAIGIDMEGHKDVLGMYVGQNESAKSWLSILNGLKNRGVEDILIACVDGLTGFPQAIEAVFPDLRSSSVSSIRSVTQQSLFSTRNSSR